jgi:hypothetical protein
MKKIQKHGVLRWQHEVISKPLNAGHPSIFEDSLACRLGNRGRCLVSGVTVVLFRKTVAARRIAIVPSALVGETKTRIMRQPVANPGVRRVRAPRLAGMGGRR